MSYRDAFVLMVFRTWHEARPVDGREGAAAILDMARVGVGGDDGDLVELVGAAGPRRPHEARTTRRAGLGGGARRRLAAPQRQHEALGRRHGPTPCRRVAPDHRRLPAAPAVRQSPAPQRKGPGRRERSHHDIASLATRLNKYTRTHAHARFVRERSSNLQTTPTPPPKKSGWKRRKSILGDYRIGSLIWTAVAISRRKRHPLWRSRRRKVEIEN